MARTGHFIYLRTRGYLDIDRDTNQVRSFVCHNTLVDEEEGKKLVNEMKKKFAIMIQETEFSTTTETEVASVENPEQIVDAVLSLVTDLQGSECTTSATSETTPHRVDTHDPDRCVTSPPLNIIAPNPSTIKSSITKSVTVIGTAAKCMEYNVRRNEEAKSGERNDSEAERGVKRWRPTNGTNGMTTTTTTTIETTTSKCERQSADGQTSSVEEPHLNGRVPPLPTSAGYFDALIW